MDGNAIVLSRAVGQPEDCVRLAGSFGIDYKLASSDDNDVGDIGIGNRKLGDREWRCQRVRPPDRQVNPDNGTRLRFRRRSKERTGRGDAAEANKKQL